MLLDKKADPAIRTRTLQTPLHLAVTYNANLNVLETLLAHGADPNAKDNQENTPFGLARFSKNSRDYVPLLRRFGGRQ
jgi:ankyrin repeat protein